MQLKWFVIFSIVLCVESQTVNAQRLTLPESRSGSRYSTFHRIWGGLQNLLRIPSPRSLNYDLVSYPPETFLSTPEIIRLHGYRVEEHKVETEDGYIISIFRIIHTPKQPNDLDVGLKKKESKVKLEPVLIQHGLVCSSDDFLQLNPKDILPYLLADSGHNVWLGNVRGNKFGKQHVNMSSNNPKFYDFTIDDLARDMPRILKYILKVENAPQLSYVCHSMGCALVSMATSDHPELNQLIKKGSFMAPGIYLTRLSSPAFLTLFTFPNSALLAFSQRYAGGRVAPMNLSHRLRKYAPGICLRENTRHFCHSALNFLAGLNPGQITNKTLVQIFGHFPADTSMRIFTQVAQLIKSGNFEKYDFGNEKNLEFYGSAEPPLYNLSRVVFPVQGFYGLNDNIIPDQDVLRAWKELGNVVEKIQVEDEKWSHLDFIYGKDARKLVYDKIILFLSS